MSNASQRGKGKAKGGQNPVRGASASRVVPQAQPVVAPVTIRSQENEDFVLLRRFASLEADRVRSERNLLGSVVTREFRVPKSGCEAGFDWVTESDLLDREAAASRLADRHRMVRRAMERLGLSITVAGLDAQPEDVLRLLRVSNSQWDAALKASCETDPPGDPFAKVGCPTLSTAERSAVALAPEISRRRARAQAQANAPAPAVA